MPENEGQPYTNKTSSDFEKRLMIKNISSMQDLPMPSPRMMKILSLLKGPVEVPRLARAIERNPALVARLLELSRDQGASSVEGAINKLGLLNIKHIVYSTTFMPFFPERESNDWEHAYSSSVLMINLMNKMKTPVSSKLPLMALLHDIGKMVLRRFNARKYRTVQEMASSGVPVFEAEEAVFHITHAVAGGILLKKWGMTDDIIAPVIHHHSQAASRAYVFDTAMIQFVDWIDEEARNISCAPPSHILLKASGLDKLLPDYWVEYQKVVINSIEGSGTRYEEERSVEDIVVPMGLGEKLKPELVEVPSTRTASIKRPVIKNPGKDVNMTETGSRRFKRPKLNVETQTLRRPISLKKPLTMETQTLRRPVRNIGNELRETSTQRFRRPLLKKK